MSIYREKTLTESDLKWIVTLPDGTAVDVDSISFEIFSVDGDGVETEQVSSTPATRSEEGVYYAEWVVPSDEPLGDHIIRWTWELNSGSETQTEDISFDVLAATTATDTETISPALYLTVDEMMDEITVLAERPAEAKLLLKIKLAQKYIEKITGQFFNQRTLTLNLNGSGNYLLKLPFPIIELTKIEFKNSDGSYTEYELSYFEVFNRYLPDDRTYPKIESDTYIFPEEKNNIRLTGSFGYVESDGSTPELIKEALKMIVRLWMFDTDTNKGNQRKSKVYFDKGQNNENRISEAVATGTLTGDPEIDNILRWYTRSGVVVSI